MNSRNVRFVVAFSFVATIYAGGCGGGSNSSSTPAVPTSPPTTPSVPDAQITGQYNIVLTSHNQGATNIYTNFTGSGKTVKGAPETLVCPSNDPAQCKGGDPANVSITAQGTVSGSNVTLTITFPSAAGEDTVTMQGASTTPVPVRAPGLVGTYSDSLGDSGSWTATPANFAMSPLGGQNLYTGTFNSTANPLTITPTISIVLSEDASSQVTGTATISNFPCGNALTLSGDEVGDAFVVSDVQSKMRLLALPSQSTATTEIFSLAYQFGANAPNCAGDVGRGTLTIGNVWNY